MTAFVKPVRRLVQALAPLVLVAAIVAGDVRPALADCGWDARLCHGDYVRYMTDYMWAFLDCQMEWIYCVREGRLGF